MCGSFLFRLTNICKLDIIALLPNKTTRAMNRVISAQDEYVVTGESRGQFRVIQKNECVTDQPTAQSTYQPLL